MADLMYIVGSLLILPAIIFALIAQFKVQSAFSQYSQVSSARGLTGAQVARRLLDENGCSHVEVQKVGGHLSDHYDPRKKSVFLSDGVYNSTSLAAIGIAAHECGHAIQHHTKYLPLMLRQIVIKSTSLINKVLLPLIIIGLIFSVLAAGSTIMGYASEDFFFYLILGFCIMYMISFLVNLITLPTEFNASSRAKKLLRKGNYIYDTEEYGAISAVLGAAALTYVAGLIVSLAYMLRFLGLLLTLSGRRRR
jgi:Zn-dependent membrane protease YugP